MNVSPETIWRFRQLEGLSRREFGLIVSVDPSTVRRWELGESRPQPWMRRQIEEIMEAYEAQRLLRMSEAIKERYERKKRRREAGVEGGSA